MKKRITKRIATVLLALVLVFTMLPATAFGTTVVGSGSFGTNVTYTLYDDGELVISGKGSMTDYSSSSSVPWYSKRSSIKTVTIDDGVTSIGKEAFSRCDSLTSIEIPNSVTSIGSYAFYGCSSVTSIEIPNSVTSIGDWAFYRCSSLTSIEIPNSVTRIGSCPLCVCSSLTSITVDKGNTVYHSAGNCIIETDSKTLIVGCQTSVIPTDGSVTSIGSCAFEICSSLTSIEISNSVTSIGDWAFHLCSSLTSIEIPNSVTSIGDWAFSGCSSLTSITVDKGNTVYHSAGNCLIETGSKTLIAGCKTSMIPNDGSVTRIGDNAFSYCYSLTSITIPDSVTSIGNNTFYQCDSLTSITIPNSVTSIGEDAFYNCYSLTSITIPNSVTSIAVGAFCRCFSLTSITIPNSVTSIGKYAFYDCGSLKSIEIPDSVKDIGGLAFYGCSSLTDVYYAGTQTQWSAISIGSNNSYLTSATIHYGCTAPISRDSTGTAQTGKLALTVYGNRNDSGKERTDYRALSGATVKTDTDSATTDSKGQATAAYSGGGVTVSKTDYVTRFLTENQLNQSRNVYLQKASEYPVISAVWMDNLYDILNEDYALPLTQSQSHKVTPEIDWGSSSKASVKLVQGTTALEVRDSLTLTWSETFDVSRDIYIVATNAAGKTTTKKLQIKCETAAEAAALSGLSFGLGDSLSFTLPEDVPVIGGMEMGLGVYSPVPVSYAVENGKVYVAIGYQADMDDDPDSASGVKEYVDAAKELRNTFSSASKNWQQTMNRLSAAKAFGGHVEGSWGVDCGFDIVGFYEGYFDGDNKLHWMDHGLIIGANGGVSYTQPFAIGPVPCYAEVGLSADASAKLNLLIAENTETITPDGTISGELALDIGAGVGVKKAATLGGGFTGKATTDMTFANQAISSATVYLGLGGYFKVSALCFEKEWSADFAEKLIYQYPNDSAACSAPLLLSGLYEAEGYTQPDLSYLTASDTEIGCTMPQLNSTGISADSSTVLRTNTYQQAAPQMVQLSDGRLLAVWTGYDGTRSGMDCLCLYYAVCQDGAWTAPAVLDVDGTMDCGFTLRMVNGQPWVVWQDAAESITAGDTMTDAAAKMNISAACFTDEGFTVYTVADAAGLDMMPALCGDGTNVYAVWVHNDTGDVFANNGTNAVCSAVFDGSAWGEAAALYTGLASLDSLDAVYRDGLQVYYAMDTDGDVYTGEDTEIYCNGNRLTENTTMDSGVSCQDGVVYYYADGALIADGKTLLASDSNLTADSYQVVELGSDRVVLFLGSNGYYATLYGIFYDSTTETWGTPVALTDGSDWVNSFSAVPAEDGLQVLINRVAMDEPDESGDPYGTAQLELLHLTLGCDLTVDDVVYDATRYVSGYDLPMSVSVTNNGRSAVSSVKITVKDGASTLVTETRDTSLPAGASEDFDIAIPITTAVQDKALTVSVEAADATERNSADNAQTVSLSYRDTALENMSYGLDADGNTILYADVVNRGYSDSGTVTVSLRKNEENGTVIDTVTTENLSSFDLQRICFTISGGDSSIYHLTLENVEDDNAANDTDYAYIAPLMAVTETGDCNGDGIVNITDLQALYEHLCGARVLADATVADVNGDNTVNILDYQALYEMVK